MLPPAGGGPTEGWPRISRLGLAQPSPANQEATQQPGALRRVPSPGLAPGWDPGSAAPSDITCLDFIVLMKVSRTAPCPTRHLEPVCHERPYQGHLSPRQHSL
ncbi:hypothetical protein CHARACLAT_033196 [Characodon lateralis]|uniref:Uncharacterized protein n=1 Tax=Characodon lateralis TaxID=208331 RepID=A0ABU7F8E3_9TELE|nr:hypothetical protein [Characodon lateralis]